MTRILCPSMMCADFSRLEDEINRLDEAGVDIYHCDIMDGVFVPNFALGKSDVLSIKELTKKLVDVHLMIENPANKVDWFIDAGADLVYIHPESERYVIKTLSHIKERGKLAGIAINPDTSIDSICEMLPLCDAVLIMTVNPGFAGQSFLQFTIKKIMRVIKLKEIYNYEIFIDGACSSAVILQLSQLGVDGFILGTSALFGKGNYRHILDSLRNI